MRLFPQTMIVWLLIEKVRVVEDLWLVALLARLDYHDVVLILQRAEDSNLILPALGVD